MRRPLVTRCTVLVVLSLAVAAVAPVAAQQPPAATTLVVHPLHGGAYWLEGGVSNAGFVVGDTGVINTWLKAMGVIAAPLPLSSNTFSVVVGLVHIGLPLMVLSLIGVLERMDKALMDAAESLGAGRARVLRRIVLPISMPGIGAGSLLVFTFTISAFITPAMLGGNRVSTISTLIYEKFTFSANWPVGATLVVVLLLINLAVITLHSRLFPEE